MLATEDIIDYVENQLELHKWNVDYIFTHTVPLQYEPVWAFIPGLDQSMVDKTMEIWLQKIVEKLEFECWFAGHYYVDNQEGQIRILYNDYEEL